MTNVDANYSGATPSASLEIGLPRNLWEQCMRGTARLVLHDLDSNGRVGIDPSRPVHPVAPGVYRLTLESPWYRASKLLSVAAQERSRCDFYSSDLEYRHITNFSLSPSLPALAAQRGHLWLRVAEGALEKSNYVDFDVESLGGDTLRLTIAGAPRPLRVQVSAPGSGAVEMAVVATMRRAGFCESLIGLELHGSVLTLVQRVDPFAADDEGWASTRSKIESGSGSGSAESADKEGSALVRRAYASVRSGSFDDIPPLLERLLDDGMFVSDGHAILAEWYSDAGCHLSALNLLLHMTEIGPPMYSGCYGLAIGRLSAMAKTQPFLAKAYSDRSSMTLSAENSSGMAFASLREFAEGRQIPYIRGQQLEAWNVKQAARALSDLTRSVATVDWSSKLLKLVIRKPAGTLNRISAATEEMVIRLRGGWIPIEWHSEIGGRVPK